MSEENLIKPKVMIVDDDQETANLIMYILKKDFHFELACDGADAQAKIVKFQPDLLITDVTMPKMDGYQLVQWIRSQSQFKNLKVLLLSGLGNLPDRIKGYEAGADDFIEKPFKALELLAKVKNFIKLKKAEDDLVALNKNLEEQIKLRSEQLLQSEKLAALGRNTAGIIHNLNNPLCAILGITTLLKEQHKDDVMIDILTKATQKMQEIVSSILKTSRSRHTARFKLLNLNDLLASELKLAESGVFSQGVKIISEFNTLPKIQGFESDFSQIFSNLIDNAMQSMVNRPKKELTVRSDFKENEIIITFKDLGCGIPPENIPKLFDPFFTTKPSISRNGEPTGTGLGLPTCKTMLESYNGKLNIESVVNEGTIMEIRIPVEKNN